MGVSTINYSEVRFNPKPSGYEWEHGTFKYIPRDLWITIPQQLVLFPINARSRPFVMMFEYFYFHFTHTEHQVELNSLFSRPFNRLFIKAMN